MRADQFGEWQKRLCCDFGGCMVASRQFESVAKARSEPAEILSHFYWHARRDSNSRHSDPKSLARDAACRKVRECDGSDVDTTTQDDAPEPERTNANGRMQPMEDPNGQRSGCLVAVDVPATGAPPSLDNALWVALGESLAEGRLAEARTLYALIDARREQPAADRGRKVG